MFKKLFFNIPPLEIEVGLYKKDKKMNILKEVMLRMLRFDGQINIEASNQVFNDLYTNQQVYDVHVQPSDKRIGLFHGPYTDIACGNWGQYNTQEILKYKLKLRFN